MYRDIVGGTILAGSGGHRMGTMGGGLEEEKCRLRSAALDGAALDDAPPSSNRSLSFPLPFFPLPATTSFLGPSFPFHPLNERRAVSLGMLTETDERREVVRSLAVEVGPGDFPPFPSGTGRFGKIGGGEGDEERD